MAALTIAQDEKGWLSTETMDFVAQYLGMPPIAVYEVASLLHDVRPEAGRAGTSSRSAPTCRARCRARTTRREHLKKKLGIGFNETTADGAFTLKEGECIGACGDAPVLLRQQQAHAVRDDARQARRTAGGAQVMGLPVPPFADRPLRSRRDHHEGPRRPQLAPEGLRGARRLRGAEEDPRREDHARADHRRGEEIRAARARRRGLPDRAQVELHAAPVSRARSTWCATPTRASRAPSRTATSCATTRTA